MLEITETAIGALQRAIGRHHGEATGVRVSLVPGSCAELKFRLDVEDAPSEGDDVVECNGVPLFLDPATGALIKGTRVDYVESLEGGTFVFQNPHAESTCVCGKSFTPARDA